MGVEALPPYRPAVARPNAFSTPAVTSWGQILLAYGCGLMAAGQLGLLAPLVPALQRDLEMTLTTAGAAISMVTFVGAALGLPAGSWAERIGHAHALGVGLLVMALAAALGAVAPDGLTLLAARGLAGGGYLLTVIAAPSLMARAASPKDQPIALALWGTFVPVGIAIAQALAGAFAAHVGWRGLFWIDAVLLLLVLAVMDVVVPRGYRTATTEPPRSVLRDAAAVRIAAAFFCFALVFLALAGLLPSYFVETHGLTEAEAGSIVAGLTAGGVLGSLLAGWGLRRGATTSRRLTIVGLLVPGAATILVFSAAIPMTLNLIGAGAAFVIAGLVPAAVFAWVPTLAAHPSAIGPVNGLIAQLGSLGSLLGPPLIAAWVSSFGWGAAPLLLLTVALAGVLCLKRTA